MKMMGIIIGYLKLWFETWIKQIYGILNVYEVVISFLYLKLLHIADSGKMDETASR